MKNLILGVALVGLAIGCKSEKSMSVSDPSAANAPKANCCAEMKKGECPEGMKAECQSKCQQAAKPQN